MNPIPTALEVTRSIRNAFDAGGQAEILCHLAHGLLDDAASAFTEIPPVQGMGRCPLYLVFAHGPSAIAFQRLVAQLKAGMDETRVIYDRPIEKGERP